MTPRPAATLVVIRQGPAGIEVLLLERPAGGFFGGLWVFPGGGVEPADRSSDARRVVAAPEGCEDFEWRAAALRETVEEVGLALTYPSGWRSVVASGRDVYRRLAEDGHRLDGQRMRLLSRWVTPAGSPTRYDARFYLICVDGDPKVVLRPDEVVDCTWTSPHAALDRHKRGEWALVTPTIHHLEWLSRYARTTDAWEAARRATGAIVRPTIESDGSEVWVTLPAAAEMP